MLVKFEQNCLVQTTRNFVLFERKKNTKKKKKFQKQKNKNKKKKRFFKTIFDKALTPFWKTFLQLRQLFNAKLLISRLP